MLANLHPFGEAGSMRLYEAARASSGSSLSLSAAKSLSKALSGGGTALLATGFIIHPFGRAETDGAVGTALLARALSRAFGAECVIAMPRECKRAVRAMGFNGRIITISKHISRAKRQSCRLMNKHSPDIAVFSECSGADKNGICRNASGADVTACQAKLDAVIEECLKRGVPTVAIGDRGNEVGFGELRAAAARFIPHGNEIAAYSKADNLVTGATTEWGIYSLIAALSIITGGACPMVTADEQGRALRVAAQSGLVDMGGEPRPFVDGIAPEYHRSVIKKMSAVIAPVQSKKPAD